MKTNTNGAMVLNSVCGDEHGLDIFEISAVISYNLIVSGTCVMNF